MTHNDDTIDLSLDFFAIPAAATVATGTDGFADLSDSAVEILSFLTLYEIAAPRLRFAIATGGLTPREIDRIANIFRTDDNPAAIATYLTGVI